MIGELGLFAWLGAAVAFGIWTYAAAREWSRVAGHKDPSTVGGMWAARGSRLHEMPSADPTVETLRVRAVRRGRILLAIGPIGLVALAELSILDRLSSHSTLSRSVVAAEAGAFVLIVLELAWMAIGYGASRTPSRRAVIGALAGGAALTVLTVAEAALLGTPG